MKYLLATALVAVVLFGAGYLLMLLAQRVTHRDWPRRGRVLGAALLGVVGCACAVAAYLGVYYHAGQAAQRALEGSANVSVTATGDGYLFDGPGERTAVIFLPGAKVEAASYAPLLLRVAGEGADCVLIDPPARFALMAGSALDRALADYRYDHWVVAGHSLGGIVASSYAAEHPLSVDGLVLLASYPTKQIEDGIAVLTIYGSEDGVLDLEAFDDARVLLPAQTRELCIPGANHANFGDYGIQKGDRAASISPQEQWDETAAAIIDLVREVEAK